MKLKINYDTDEYNFRGLVRKSFERKHQLIDPLPELHNSLSKDIGLADYNKTFQKIGLSLVNIYESLLNKIIKPLFDRKVLYYHHYPFLQLHLPNDPVYGHVEWNIPTVGRKVIYVTIPLTRMWKTNTICIKNNGLHSVDLNVGELFLIDTDVFSPSYYKNNGTNFTRISINFGLLLEEETRLIKDA